MLDQPQTRPNFPRVERRFDKWRQTFATAYDSDLALLFMFAFSGSLLFLLIGNLRTEGFSTQLFRWFNSFFQNFGTEMFGAVITFILIEVLLDNRRAYEVAQREKERLILQVGSPDKAFAVEAVRQLDARWLAGCKMVQCMVQTSKAQIYRASTFGRRNSKRCTLARPTSSGQSLATLTCVVYASQRPISTRRMLTQRIWQGPSA